MDRPAVMTALLVVALAYLVGSVNSAILALRLSGRGDPRQMGSGNPGVSNVYRVAGLGWAALVLVVDLGKAAALAWLARRHLPADLVPLVGLGLVVGNRYPCLHRFRGGKGVAAFLGFCLVLAPMPTALGLGAWLVGRFVGRASTIGSCLMVPTLGAGLLVTLRPGPVGQVVAVLTVLLILWAHRGHFRRSGPSRSAH